MINDFQSVESLVGGIKGTTGLIARLLSRKSALAFLFIVVGVVVSKLLLG